MARPATIDGIINAAFEDKTPESETPFFLVLAAAPSSGKSAMSQLLRDKGIADPAHTVFISEKLFKHWSPSRTLKKVGVQHPEKTDGLVLSYHQAVERIIDRAKRERLSIVLEDHGDDKEWMTSLIKTIPEDYEKLLIGIGQDQQRYTDKMQKRAEDEKVVDHQRILALLRDFSINWDDFITMFDYSALYYRKGTSEPELAAEFKNFGETRIIYGQKNYAAFRSQRFLDPSLDPEAAWSGAKAAAESQDHFERLGESRASRWGRMIDATNQRSK